MESYCLVAYLCLFWVGPHYHIITVIKSLKHNYKSQFVIIVAFVYPEYLTVSMMDECFVQCDILATELVHPNPLSIIRANTHESEERKI